MWTTTTVGLGPRLYVDIAIVLMLYKNCRENLQDFGLLRRYLKTILHSTTGSASDSQSEVVGSIPAYTQCVSQLTGNHLL